VRVKTTVRLAALAGLAILTAPGAVRAQQPTSPTVDRQPVGVATVGQPMVVPTVTLEEAIKLALKVQPAVVTAAGNVGTAHAQQRQAVGNWLPTVTANSSVQRRLTSTQAAQGTGTVSSGLPNFSYSNGLNANLLVWDFGRRIFQHRQQNANADAMDAALVNQQFQVTLQTKQAFFNALAAAELERVRQTALQRAEQNLKITKEKLAAGSAIRSDTLTSTVLVGQARLDLLNAQTSRATQLATLARLIGYDGPVQPLGDSANVALLDVDTASIRAEVLKSSPPVQQADAQAHLQEAVVNVNRIAYLPTINASYNNSFTGNSPKGETGSWTGGFAFGSLTPTSSFTLSLSWPLFNGFVRETNLATAMASRDAAAATAADTRRGVNASVTQWLSSLEAARAQVSIAAASREAADEALRISQERYRLGAATIVEVLQAQQNLGQAEVDGVNARVSYQIAKAQIEALLGRAL